MGDRKLGEIVIDPMSRGFKVSTRVFHPTTGKPEIVGSDQLGSWVHAQFFAVKLRDGLGLPIVDNTRRSGR